jgi:hypothetical protein
MNHYRREFHHSTYTTNLADPVSGFTPFSILDPRGNGQTITVSNNNPAALTQINELDTTSPNNRITFNGIDTGLTVRMPNGANVAGGTSTGRTVSILCDIEDPNYVSATAAGLRFCDQSQSHIPWLTTVKFSGSYPLPAGFRLSGVLQSSPGDLLTQTYVLTAANFKAQTGVTMAQSSITVRLTEPGSLYLARVNQLDLTISRSFNVGRARISPEVSLFNLLNPNPVLSETTAYPNVSTPLRILDGRLVRFQAQIRF